jgi:hypothetical protein
VLLIDGVPGIVIASRGRAQVLLEIGIGADHRIHSIDISGDADRLHRAILALPNGVSQEHRSLIGYQGERTQSAGRSVTGQDRKHDAR